MERHRKNSIPLGLSLLAWPAVARAPWLVDLLLQDSESPGSTGRDRYGRRRREERY
jgi:hypothetical protein